MDNNSAGNSESETPPSPSVQPAREPAGAPADGSGGLPTGTPGNHSLGQTLGSPTDASEPLPERLIERIDGDGPVLICIGGLHGNEPGGVIALERVCRDLREARTELGGTLVAMRGNRPALALNQRMLERDLNRVWSAESLERLLGRDPADDDATDRELRELWWEIKAAHETGRPLYLLDLHSTSGLGPPFSVVLGCQSSQALAARVGLPCVHGLNESIQGTMAAWFADGWGASMVAEGGQSGVESTIRHLESVIYSAMAAAGLLPPDHTTVVFARQLLQQATEDLPRHVRVFHREPTAELDFRMGEARTRRFRNFDLVRQGDLLAQNREGPIEAIRDGYLVMPLYQDEGSDGFFLAEPVSDPSITLS